MLIRYVAFLRGINVGGNAIIKMTDLKAAFEAAGCTNVRTFIASGNVIFDAPEKTAPAVFRKVAAGVKKLLGKGEPVIMYRTAQDLVRTFKSQPFKSVASDPKVKLYVAMLLEKPTKTPKLPWAFPKEGVEVIAVKGLEVFVISRPLKNGRMYGFPNLAIEKELGVPATSRNWNTVTKIVALCGPGV